MENSSQDRDAIARLELLHLERQFRVMKNDEEACPGNIRRAFAKQKKLIKGLESEKDEILTSLIAFDKNQVEFEHERASSEVLQLLLLHKQLEDTVAAKKEDLQDLNTQIQVAAEKVENKIRTRGGAGLIAEAMQKEEKSDENLENRLHNEACRYNERMMRNALYGREVEDLLKERERFQKIFGALSKDLISGRKIITDLIEQSSYAFEQRREADTKLNALKSKAKHELLLNCSEARHLERSVCHRIKLNAFLAQKSNRRTVMSIEEEKAAKIEGAFREMTDFLEKYGQIVNEIQERFGEDDMDRLVMQFMKLEEDNYNMCKFINDLNEKLDQMRDEICRLQQAITEQREVNKQEKEEQSKIIANLESDTEIQRRMVSLSRQALISAKEFVDNLQGRISALFFLVDCNADEILKKLGKNREIRVDNVMMYLKTLEHRFKELKIMSHQYLKNSKLKSGIRSLSLYETKIPACKTELPDSPCPLCAEGRDLSEVDEAFAVPLGIDECREQLQEELKKGFRNDFLHSVANCHLPKSRRIMQKRKGL